MLLHVFAHVHAHHRVGIVKQEFGEGFGEVRFAHTGGSHEEEGAEGFARVAESDARAADGVGYRGDCLVLPDDLFAQPFFHVEQFLCFAFHEAENGNACPLRHDFGDVLRADVLFEEARTGGGVVRLSRQGGLFYCVLA